MKEALNTKRLRNGVPKRDFENALQQLNDQVRMIEQKLTMKVDNEVTIQYQKRYEEVNYTKNRINKIHKLYKHNYNNILFSTFPIKNKRKLS